MITDVLTGPIQAGKTTLLQKITQELQKEGILVGGFLNLSVHEQGQIIGYDLYDLRQKTVHPFLRKLGHANWEKIGPYAFIPGTLEQAKRIILQAKTTDICFVDEVGPYEIERKGLWPALASALKRPAPDLFLTVRARLLDAYLDRIGKKIGRVFDVADEDVHLKIMIHLEKKLDL